MSTATLLEKFFLRPNEKIVREENIKFEGGLTFQSKKVKGRLILTNYRIIFIAGKGQLGKKEKVVLNIPLERLFLSETESSFITSLIAKTRFASLSRDYLVFSFEDWFGVMQRPRFKTSESIEWSETIDNISFKVMRSSEAVFEIRKKINEFKEFATYLSIEKFVRPLFFDPISRVIQIANKQIFIDENWKTEGSQDIVDRLDHWIRTFKAKDVKTRWLMQPR